MNPTHKALREATADAHDRVDTAFAAFDLGDREQYARFLKAHAEVVWPLEDALPGERIVADWQARKRGHLLREDLAFLRQPGTAPEPERADPAIDLASDEASLAGVLYVLEGSRLGGRFLARRLPQGFPRAYLDTHQGTDKWQQLLGKIDTILRDPVAFQSALAAAHAVFAAFEKSAHRWAKG